MMKIFSKFIKKVLETENDKNDCKTFIVTNVVKFRSTEIPLGSIEYKILVYCWMDLTNRVT